MNTKRKTIIALVAFVLCLVFVSPALIAADANGTQKTESRPSLFSQEPPTQLADDNLGSSLYRMMLSLVVVIGLAIGAMYVSRKVLPKVSGISGKRVKVLETVSLGSRRAVHLLEVEGRQILVGSTQNTVTRLTEFAVGNEDADQKTSDVVNKTVEGA